MIYQCLVIRKIRALLMVVSLALPGWAGATEIQWVPKKDNMDFTVMMPAINIDALVDDIATLKVSLKHDEKILSRRVEEKSITNSESVLSFILPGGLIYAAYRKNAHANAVKEHERVSSQLLEISSDLVALTTMSGPVLVAKR